MDVVGRIFYVNHFWELKGSMILKVYFASQKLIA